MDGNQLLQAVKNLLVAYGQDMTVYRPSDATTRTVRLKPQDDDPGVEQMFLEAGANASNPDRTLFVGAGDADVKEGDRITYSGYYYTVRAIHGSPFMGIVPKIAALGIRTQEAA